MPFQRVLESDRDVLCRAVGDAGEVSETELDGDADILGLARPGEPLASQFLDVPLGIKSVPELAAALESGVKDLESTRTVRPRSRRGTYPHLDSVSSSAF